MPTLFRLLVIIAVFAGLGYAGLYALATYLQPHEREITVVIPTDRLSR